MILLPPILLSVWHREPQFLLCWPWESPLLGCFEQKIPPVASDNRVSLFSWIFISKFNWVEFCRPSSFPIVSPYDANLFRNRRCPSTATLTTMVSLIIPFTTPHIPRPFCSLLLWILSEDTIPQSRCYPDLRFPPPDLRVPPLVKLAPNILSGWGQNGTGFPARF